MKKYRKYLWLSGLTFSACAILLALFTDLTKTALPTLILFMTGFFILGVAYENKYRHDIPRKIK